MPVTVLQLKYLDMSNLLSLLKPFLAAVNLAVVAALLILGYSLFGESVLKTYRAEAELVDKATHRATKGSGAEEDDFDKVIDGIHVQSGLIYADGFDLVRGTCTACHSAKLVTQNRATREGWTEMIRWMQAKQGLWDLGVNEPIILDYLAANYAPEETGRRMNIDVEAIEWYILDLESK
jgi:hypothetical protein